MSTGGPHGILLVDKSAGWTSHDVVAKARRLTAQRKIGHTGTLDPMATGLLVLCLGDATRLVEYMAEHDKRYTGEIVLGVRTDTDDAEGQAVEERPVPEFDRQRLAELEAQFTGRLQQRPPAYSAIKVAGQRAYAVARRGEQLDLPARPVTVHRLCLAKAEGGRLRLEVGCSAGTYVRSLARDVGEALGCGGHLGALRRTIVGGFAVDEAITLETLAAVSAGGRLEAILRQPDEALLEARAALVHEAHARDFGHGRSLALPEGIENAGRPIRVYDPSGTFLGVGAAAEGWIRPLKVLSSVQNG